MPPNFSAGHGITGVRASAAYNSAKHPRGHKAAVRDDTLNSGIISDKHGKQDSSFVTAMAQSGKPFATPPDGTGDCWSTNLAGILHSLVPDGFGPDDTPPGTSGATITGKTWIGVLATTSVPVIINFIEGRASGADLASTGMDTDLPWVCRSHELPKLDPLGPAPGAEIPEAIQKQALTSLNKAVTSKLTVSGRSPTNVPKQIVTVADPANAPMAKF